MSVLLGYALLWLILIAGNALGDFLVENEIIESMQPDISRIGRGLVHALITVSLVSSFVIWYPFLTKLMLALFIYEVAVHYYVEKVQVLFGFGPLFNQVQHALFKLMFVILIFLTGGVIIV